MFFGERIKSKGKKSTPAMLGNKGYNLLQMANLGLPVPCGFILKTKSDVARLPTAISQLEKLTGRVFANKENPLLVSVRSSPKVSMPGMLDTILNVAEMQQLKKAVGEVFASWNSPRAKKMRAVNGIGEKLGTAVIVQEMVFGNLPKNSCAGVFYSRHPLTGAKKIYGEYIKGMQGDAVVGGLFNAKPISNMPKTFAKNLRQLKLFAKKLDRHFQHLQEIEFTIENGKLWLLQTRNAKLEAKAQIKIAIDMVGEKVLKKKQAVKQCLPFLQKPNTKISLTKKSKLFAKGLSASSGAVSGKVYFSVARAVAASKRGEKIILLRPNTSPKDVAAIVASAGIVTARGGKTSHAAIIARGLGKPCIVGAIQIKIEKNSATAGGQKINEGDVLTLDANSGNVYLGKQKIISAKVSKNVATILSWQKTSKKN